MTELPASPPIEDLAETLRRDGIVVLPPLLPPDSLVAMRRAFESRLSGLRFNTRDGYEVTEPYRDVVENVLLLEQGFVDLALHPAVVGILRSYLGPDFALAEAKGWRSRPTRRDFHGWHADAWYDKRRVGSVVREVKLALYLTDVTSGAFNYLRGTHGREHPRIHRNEEVAPLLQDRMVEVLGAAGTAFLFDTGGIHRQGVPMLEPRQAVFYCYHDPSVPLQDEDVAYNRYHPLLLNAAFLGSLTKEHERVLGFGDKANSSPGFVRGSAAGMLHRAAELAMRAWLLTRAYGHFAVARMRRL
jgi:hypothetical protein